ncbi:hypothetical protein BDZ89DRAFT_1048472 [Hymenopellis radicata]|nr:hypothetical protein BDZ89DRAFT_1048472 [Hymenopellis radicata]
MSSFTALLDSLRPKSISPPISALNDELATIQRKITDSVEAQIDSRRHEVEMWMAKCEAVEHTCSLYSKVLGGHIKNTGKSVGELRKEKVLPHRLKLASDFEKDLSQLYNTKLEERTALSSRLHAMARVLGSDFFTPDLLDDDLDTSVLRDVSPEIFLRMEEELARGKEEVSKRMKLLHAAFIQIDRLSTELGRTPSSLDDLRMDPFVTSTPTPTSRNQSLISHREEVDCWRIFNNFVAKGERNPLVSLEHVEPTPGLLKWAEDLQTSLEDEKRKRETHIQVMYDEMQDIVKRFAVKEVDMVAFGNAHPGCTDDTIQEYELELARMKERKRARISVAVVNAREEIIKLWDELMVAEEERQGFAAFSDDAHTEQLLNIHEAEIEELEAEKLMKAPLLAVIKKYIEISKEEEALATPDPTSLNKSYWPTSQWELKAGRSFLVYGESLLEKLNADRENKQKPLRVGSVPPRSTTPATKSGVVVPAVRHAGSSEQSGPNKRIKLDQSTDRAGFSRSRSASGSKQNAASSLPMPIPKPGTGRVHRHRHTIQHTFTSNPDYASRSMRNDYTKSLPLPTAGH